MRTSFHHQPEAQHPKTPAIETPAGRLPHLLGIKQTSRRLVAMSAFDPYATWARSDSPNEIYGTCDPGDFPDYSSLMPASLITTPHLSMSNLRRAANSLRNDRPAGAFDGPMVELLEKLPSSHRPCAFNCSINCLACGDNSLNG
jgi:hypothetical protein